MSDIFSAGYYADQASKRLDKLEKEGCPKAKDKKHEWDKYHNMWTCKKCKETIYWK